MKELEEPFKLDKSGLWYLSSHDIKIEPLYFPNSDKQYPYKKSFYKIDGIDDYIIKDSTLEPLFFNGIRNRNLLRQLVNKQEELPDIGFPIGYYKSFGVMKGTIVPYYQNGESVKQLSRVHRFDELSNYYHHESNQYDNLISLFLDILDLISKMYDKGIIYVDANSGNFLVSNNEVKVIDFDTHSVFFGHEDYRHYHKMLDKYATLVKFVCRRYGYINFQLDKKDTFMETEREVKALKKRLER